MIGGKVGGEKFRPAYFSASANLQNAGSEIMNISKNFQLL